MSVYLQFYCFLSMARLSVTELLQTNNKALSGVDTTIPRAQDLFQNLIFLPRESLPPGGGRGGLGISTLKVALQVLDSEGIFMYY